MTDSYQATPDDNQLVAEFEAEFRNADSKPQFIGCTWSHFQKVILGEKIRGKSFEAQEVMFFGRMDGEQWHWDTCLEELVATMRDLYLED